MAQIFSKKMNALLPAISLAGVALLAFAVFFFWYFGSTRYTDVGYRPGQPVDYSHKLHAGDLGMDCRYCHYQVEQSNVANVPSTGTCMNCHELIGKESSKLAPVRESWNADMPVEWVRVHMLPNYAYFNHQAMLRAGVACNECHGRVDQMVKVMQMERLSMSWCLECHRDPKGRLRPPELVTEMDWQPGGDYDPWYQQHYDALALNPPTDCSGCHR